MRASHLAVMITVLALPSAAYSQDSSQVDGRVGPDLNISPMQTSSSLGSIGPYHRPPGPGPRAGYSSAVLPGQVVPFRHTQSAAAQQADAAFQVVVERGGRLVGHIHHRPRLVGVRTHQQRDIVLLL